MKKIILTVMATLLLFSCNSKYYVTSGGLDFTSLTKDGFFITESNSVNFEYNPIGLVYATSNSGDAKYTKRKSSDRSYPTRNWKWANYEDAIFYLKKEAVSRGANGIINLKYSKTLSKEGNVISVDMSGMAIKINK